MLGLKKNIFKNEVFKLSCMIFGYFFSVLFLFNIFMLFNIKNSLILINIISIIVPIILYFCFSNNTDRNKKILILAIYLFMIVALPFLFGRTYDLTYDGNSYHKVSIGYIKNDWNPLYESSKEFQQLNNLPQTEEINLWIDHYPKGSWIIGATIYSMTGNIESGKCLTFDLLVAMFLMVYIIILNIFSRREAILIALISILNPVVLVQLFNYYVDGLIGICFACQLILLLIINPEEKQNDFLWLYLLSVVSLFINLKFTGFLYSGILAAIFYFYWIIKIHKKNNFMKLLKDITIRFVIVFGIAILIIGSSSYVKNTIEHKNPLYPLIGKDSVDIITTKQPKVFGEVSSITKFTWSLFSRTENVTYYSGNPKLKNPLMIYKSEIDSLLLPDTRIAGFGPWFGIIFIISLFASMMCIYELYRKEGKKIFKIALPIIAIVVSIIAVGESWWARYIPQLYLVPVISMLVLIYSMKRIPNYRLFKISFLLLVLMIFVNASFFIYARFNEIKSFVEIRNDLKIMSETPDLKLKFSDDHMYGYYYNLEDYNIKYKYVDEIKEENTRYMYYWRVKIDTER